MVEDVVRNDMKIASPSKLMEEYGIFISQGLANGIQQGMDAVKNATVDVSGVVQEEVGKIMDAIIAQGTSLDELDAPLINYKLTQELANEATAARMTSLPCAGSFR